MKLKIGLKPLYRPSLKMCTTCLEVRRNFEFVGVKAYEDVDEDHDADGKEDGEVGYHHSNLNETTTHTHVRIDRCHTL